MEKFKIIVFSYNWFLLKLYRAFQLDHGCYLRRLFSLFEDLHLEAFSAPFFISIESLYFCCNTLLLSFFLVLEE